MSMPQIPENKHRPSLKCVVIDLLESVAMEEISISHLINAEAEKIQAFVGNKTDFPFCNEIKEVMDFSKIISDFLEKIIMKQWILLNKLNKIIEIGKPCFHHNKCDDDEKYYDCTRPLKRFCRGKQDE
ncbi:MAG: hypothetical protein PHW90_02185 [Bacilli bacterium]|nr:hypothetical protein [Bacilli bacterium]